MIAFVNGSVRILGATLMGRVMQGLVSDLATDRELGSRFREQIVSTRLAEVRRLLDLGVKRGELRSDIDAALVHDILFGPVYYRLLLSGDPLHDHLARDIVDAILPSLAATT